MKWWRITTLLHWFINNYRLSCSKRRYDARFIWSYISTEDHHRTLYEGTRPPLTKPLIIFVTMWFMLTEHGPDLSCCRGGGQWSRMAGVDPRVAWGVRELPESYVYMSRCRQLRRPRPIVYANRDSRSPETIGETRRPITMTVKNRESDLIWHIYFRISRYLSTFTRTTFYSSVEMISKISKVDFYINRISILDLKVFRKQNYRRKILLKALKKIVEFSFLLKISLALGKRKKEREHLFQATSIYVRE